MASSEGQEELASRLIMVITGVIIWLIRIRSILTMSA